MASFDEGISQTLSVLRRKGPMTRAAIVADSGLSRSAINLRLEALAEVDLVRGVQGEVATKGRPADLFAFNPARGKLLAADIGATKMRIGLCDLAGAIELEEPLLVDVASGPEPVLTMVLESFERLLEKSGTGREQVLGIGISLPAPVKSGAGMTVSPPIIPRWNRFDVPHWFAPHFACPVFLEKDANAMAYGEARAIFPDVEDLMMVKVGTGIGSGIVHQGRLFRGADGAAGDIGHTQVAPLDDDDAPLCKCGNRGCLEAYASGWAMLRDLQAAGVRAETSDDLAALISAGDAQAMALVRESGRLVGSAIARSVNLVNPRVLVVAGRVVNAGGELFVAGIREMVYRRSLPLATSELQIVSSTLYPRAGLLGLVHLIGDGILAPDQIGRLVPRPH